jgi:hypothetical protein
MDETRCPYCGQPLVDEHAIEHLRRSRSKLEAEARREADARAKLS